MVHLSRQSFAGSARSEPMTELVSPTRGSLRSRRGRVELGHELLHAAGGVVADRAHLVARQALRVAQVPVEVALAGDVRAGVATAHRDDDVGARGEVVVEALRPAAGEVAAELAH